MNKIMHDVFQLEGHAYPLILGVVVVW